MNDTVTGPTGIASTSEQAPTVGEYLLAMSHEVRAPLNAVIGMSALLLDGELTEKHRQYARSVHKAGESLAAVLNDLIDLSRVAADRLAIEPIPFDLRSMVEETASVLSPRAAERGLGLRVDWRPELPRHVVGDPGRARQVLGNLVGHAVNSTSQGEVVIRVLPDGERGGVPLVRFVVEDTGIGIMPDRLANIFARYVPVDASPYRSFGVTGLGLRLSADLVRRMGGEIGAESEVGKGSRFWFVLPMPSAPASGALELDRSSAGGRILIVESDTSAKARFRTQVEVSGWSADFVDDANHLADALRAAASEGRPFSACLISDYAVRPLHVDLATRLKAEPAFAMVALIMVTAVGSPGEGKKLWHAGFAAYLRKPVPDEEIHDTLAALHDLSPDGRGPSLITRHSLAEIRNAETFASADIDEMLASLTPALAAAPEPAPVAEVPLAEAAPSPAVVEPAPVAVPVFGAIVRQFAPDPIAEPSPVSIDTLVEVPITDTAAPEVAVAEITPVEAAAPDLTAAEAETSIVAPDLEVADLPAALAILPAPPTQTNDEATEPRAAVTAVEPGIEEIEAPSLTELVTNFTAAPAALTEPALELLAVIDDPIAPAEPPAPDLIVEPVKTVEDLLNAPDRLEPVDDPTLSIERDGEWAAPDAAVEPVEGFDRVDPDFHDAALQPTLDDVVPPGDSIGAPDLIEPEIQVEAPSAEPSTADPPILSIPLMALVPVADATPDEVPLPEPMLGQPIDRDPVTATVVVEVSSMTIVEPELGDHESAPIPVKGTIEVLEEIAHLDVMAPEFEDQVARGGFFVQHVLVTCVREVPLGIADLAAACARADATAIRTAAGAITAAIGPIGAARLLDTLARIAAEVDAGRLDAAAGHLGTVEHAFLELRQALDAAAPTGLPTDVPPVGPTFLEQISVAQGPARALSLKLAESFVSDGEVQLADLANAVRSGQAEQAQRLAQTLKGMCGLVGADSLGKLCALADADARLKRVSQAERYLPYLEREFGRVRAALDRARG
ncbi:MAG: hypothetical protein FJ206_02595 [Gemmatimonadetes bacterium]|nr:hypothetical protein [Gemmatimonadota bacterium]